MTCDTPFVCPHCGEAIQDGSELHESLTVCPNCGNVCEEEGEESENN